MTSSRARAATGSPAAHVVAIDLGADSCRVSLVEWRSGAARLKTVHRFPNSPRMIRGHLYWDIRAIYAGLLEGLSKCAQQADGTITSIGVDGWAVDYVRLGKNSELLGSPFCYRDPRTESSQTKLWTKISRERIYELTGIQHLPFNTLYQLYADRCNGVGPGHFWLNIPEYILQQLGGRPVAEFTNARHTQLVEARRPDWCDELFSVAGLDRRCAPEIVPPGTDLGTVRADLAKHPALHGTRLIAPSCHDTGSAVAGIPAEGDDWAFISSGTWSLIGTLLPEPCTHQQAQKENFSNEGGLGGQVRFLKNVNGMWLLQQCLEEWRKNGARWDLSALIAASQHVREPKDLLAVDDPALLLPGNMPERINSVLIQQGGSPIASDGSHAPEVANLLFHSLAARYAEVLQKLAAITGKVLRRIYIVGGGSKNVFLNELIAARTGMEIVRGPIESSTIGNLAVQFAVLDNNRSARTGVSPPAVRMWSDRLSLSLQSS